MPIPATPSALDIMNEFGATNQPTSIRNAGVRLGLTASTISTRLDFTGLGKPVVSSFVLSTSATSASYLEADFTLTTNGLTSSIIVQYQEDDGSVPDPGSWITESTYTYGTDGAKTIDFQVPAGGQSYHVQLLYYNDFNDQATSDYKTSVYDTATSSAPPQLATPQSFTIDDLTGIDLGLSWTDTNDAVYTDDYQVEIIHNSGTAELYSGADWSNTVGWGASGAKSGDIELNFLPSQGDVIEARIRALDNDDVAPDSSYSAQDSFTNN